MANDKLLSELDGNMDTVYDNLYVLNAAVTALVQSLQPQSAAQATERIDLILDELPSGRNPPGNLAQEMLRGWRNMAAQTAGVGKRGPLA